MYYARKYENCAEKYKRQQQMVLSAAFDWRQTFNKYTLSQIQYKAIQRNVLPRIKLRVADDDTPQLLKETHQKMWYNVKVGNFGIFSKNMR